MDKMPWDSHAKLVIIDDLNILLPKAVLYFKSMLHVPPPPPNKMLKVRKYCGDVFSTLYVGWGEGQATNTLSLGESFFCTCLKSHKCTNIPRFLSMIVAECQVCITELH